MGNDLILCKKLDTVMEYVDQDDIYLASRDFCGYIALMNSGKSTTNNCKSVKAIINDVMRIIIYTTKTIEEG
jgi:hypothetical protein